MSGTPHPKRLLWLKRLTVATAILITLLVGLRLLWGHRVQSRLDALITDIHAKGEPILFEDLTADPLPDTDNGAWYLQQALAHWPHVPGQPGVLLDDTDWYLEGEEAGFTDPITDNAAYLEACQPALDFLRQAQDIEQASWNPTLTRPLFEMTIPHLAPCRRLARHIDDAARRALEIGDIEFVLDTLLLQHTVSRHVHGQHPNIIDSLVAISIMAMDRHLLEQSLPQIKAADLRADPTRQKAKQLITLLTDNMLHEGMTQGLIRERAAIYDVCECLIDGTSPASDLLYSDDIAALMIDTPGLRYAYQPSLKNEQAVLLLFYNQHIEALRRNAPPQDIRRLGDDMEYRLEYQAWRYPIASLYTQSIGTALRVQYRSQTLLHCAATALAIKLYEADHGQRPDTLDALVPGYLPAIPIDPYSPTGEPIRYNPEGIVPTIRNTRWLNEEQKQRIEQSLRPYPVLYSVGADGIDDQGGPLFVEHDGTFDESNSARYPSSDDRQGDIWFMLDAWPEAVIDESEFEPIPFAPGFPPF